MGPSLMGPPLGLPRGPNEVLFGYDLCSAWGILHASQKELHSTLEGGTDSIQREQVALIPAQETSNESRPDV